MTSRAERRNDLGDFLRSRRAAAAPDAAGLPVAAGRRVQGLRREEVAQLAGLSVDYYARLEQGRHASPSRAVVEALARALGLDAAARAHLHDLAGPSAPRTERPAVQRVRPAVHQLLDSLGDHPAFVLGRRTDVLASNALARALLSDWDALPTRQRNYVRWLLLDPAARTLFPDWEVLAAEAVGTLRLDAGRHPGDPRLNSLVGELTIGCPEFGRWWSDRRVHERTHGTKRVHHPVVGEVTIRFEALALSGEEDQTLFVYSTEPGSASADNLRLLSSWTAGTGPAARSRSNPPGGG
ncbi:helix-turn-helix transcriptional regulator [Kineococcus sp. SYSU DK005]|uniref:helix-turn-helix transcriptional regulator n=1 Tax=Kineococcus sp. SYSU DK005 TaxID=3383126 RepID=UPI003D7D8A83